MGFFKELKTTTTKIGRTIKNKAKDFYDEKMEERQIYKDALKEERIKQIKLKAKQKAKDRYGSNKNKLFGNDKEYF